MAKGASGPNARSRKPFAFDGPRTIGDGARDPTMSGASVDAAVNERAKGDVLHASVTSRVGVVARVCER